MRYKGKGNIYGDIQSGNMTNFKAIKLEMSESNNLVLIFKSAHLTFPFQGRNRGKKEN